MYSKSVVNKRMINHLAVLTYPVRQCTSVCRRVLQQSRFLCHATGKFRRFCLVHLRKEYVRQQLLVREGNCRQCGTCCNLLFTCPMLTKEGGCLTYGICRPQACKVFPIDQRDIQEVKICGKTCGYQFNRTSR